MVQMELMGISAYEVYAANNVDPDLSESDWLASLQGQSLAGTTAGDMQYWNGSAWVIVPSTGNEGASLQLISGVPTWVGGTPPSSNATAPGAPTIGTATAGDAEATVPLYSSGK